MYSNTHQTKLDVSTGLLSQTVFIVDIILPKIIKCDQSVWGSPDSLLHFVGSRVIVVARCMLPLFRKVMVLSFPPEMRLARRSAEKQLF